MADVREPGYLVRDGRGRVLFDAYGANAEYECAEWARVNRVVGGYRIEATTRLRSEAALAAEREAARVAALLAGTSRVGKVDVRSMPDEVEREGYKLGRAFARLMAPGGTADSGALVDIGMMLAELRGYRDMRTGNMFVGGFVNGFQENCAQASADRAARITGPSASGGADKSPADRMEQPD